MAYTERAERAAVSCGTSYVTTKTAFYLHHFGEYSVNALWNDTVNHLEQYATKSAVSLLESGQYYYIKAIFIIFKVRIHQNASKFESASADFVSLPSLVNQRLSDSHTHRFPSYFQWERHSGVDGFLV